MNRDHFKRGRRGLWRRCAGWLRLVLMIGCGMGMGGVRAQMVNPPPAPYWLAPPTAEGRGGAGVFRHRFEVVDRGRLLKAIVLVACDPGAILELNGSPVKLSASADQALGYDVGRWVRPGSNDLSIHYGEGQALPLLALRLELNFDGAGQQWVVSDGTWKWSREGEKESGVPRVILRVDEDAGMNPFDARKSVDAYNSWKLALRPGEATAAEGLVLQPGFRAERIRSAAPEEGSWIAMAFDRDGSLVLARERRGLLRLSMNSNRVDRVRVVEDSLLECRGLVFTGEGLFVNANNSKKLCRLVDADGDGSYEKVEEILLTEGGVGHGRNHLKLGPDGWLYVAHGNNVKLPGGDRLSLKSPFRNYREDQLQPCPWDGGMFDGDVTVPAGHVLRVHPLTREVQLFAAGFRNPMDLAFNAEGELFTFDADMEWDIGAPWYMPNRVLHVVSGGEYGFRRGTGRFPVEWPDTLPSVVDVGLASPTAVTFGSGAHFPKRYRDALYLCDWAYGRILAVHLEEKGASYGGKFEDFVTGRPLNVTDLCVGPDGALWFITGGRGTQSGLYRLVYEGAREEPGSGRVASGVKEEESLRRLRRQMEALHEATGAEYSEEVLDKIWSALGHRDRHVRYAARVALERLDVARWKARVIGEGSELNAGRWEAALALARVGAPEDQEALFRVTARWASGGLDDEGKLLALRIWTVSGARHGVPGGEVGGLVLKWVENGFPLERMELNRLAGAWLRAAGSPRLLPGALEILRKSSRGQDWLMGTFWIRDLELGWSVVAQVRFLEALRSAHAQQGGKAYFQSLDRIRQEFLDRRTMEEREALKHWLVTEEVSAVERPVEVTRVQVWKMEDLDAVVNRVPDVTAGGRLRGRLAFVRAQCNACHQVSGAGGGQVGPDLAGVGNRFGRRDLLRHILEPSLAVDEKFRALHLGLKDGQEWTGMLVRESDHELVLAAALPGGQERRVARKDIETRRVSEISPMPAGLLDVLHPDEVGGLLDYLQSK